MINLIIYYGVICYWLTQLSSIIAQYFNDLIIFENYDIDVYKNHTCYILIVNFILFLLSIDNELHYLIFITLYIVNIIEFYVNCCIYKYVLYDFKYLLICLHLIILCFFFNHTSPFIYMTSCLIIGIL